MRRFIYIFAFMLLSFNLQAQVALWDQLNMSEMAKTLEEHVKFLSSPHREGRGAGSEGEYQAALYVTDKFAEYGIDVLSGEDAELFGILQESGDTLKSHNVIGFIPGYDKKLRDQYIVIGARLDNIGIREVTVNGEKKEQIFCGANGNASGLSMLIELAKMLNNNRVLLKRSVIVAAFGSSLNQGAGSWYFLNRSFSGVENIDAMINLDMLGTGSRGFYAYTGSNADLNKLINWVNNETLQPVTPKIVAMEPVESDHRSFHDKQIPFVFFTTGMYPEYNSVYDTAEKIEYNNLEREMDYVFNFTVELANAEKPAFMTEEEAKLVLKDQEVVSYYDCDTPPIFMGSSSLPNFLTRWVYVYLRYPKAAVDAGIQGKVTVSFVIDQKGKVGDVKVVKGVSEELDAEAVRAVAASPDWKPAKVDGKKVKCLVTLPIEFRLEKRK
ncbi:MAG: TonB family protein [Bacteroidales bacterium]|nr:TonB family protein [Bacteroidales bacterium]